MKQKLDTEIKKEQATDKGKEEKKAKKDKKPKKKANTGPILQVPVMVDVTVETAQRIDAPKAVDQRRISVPFGTWRKGTHAAENKQKMLGEARTSKPMLIVPLSSNNLHPSLISPRDIIPTTSSKESNQEPLLLSPRNYSDPSPFVSYAEPSKSGPVLSKPESTRVQSMAVKPIDLPNLSAAPSAKPRSKTTSNVVVIPPVKGTTSSTTNNTSSSSKAAPNTSARPSGSSVSIAIPVIPPLSSTPVTPSANTSAEIPSLPSASFSPASKTGSLPKANTSTSSTVSLNLKGSGSLPNPTKRATSVTIGANTASSKRIPNVDLDTNIEPVPTTSVPLPLEITELVEKEEAATYSALNEWLPYYLKIAVRAENVRGILTIARVVKFVNKVSNIAFS